MAVTTDQLTISVSIKTGDSSKQLNAVVNNMEDVVAIAEKMQKSFAPKQVTWFASLKEQLKGLQMPFIALNQALQLAEQGMRALASVYNTTVSSSINLESSVAEITTLLTEQQRKTIDVTKDIVELNKQYGGDKTDIAKAYYQAISSGAIDAADATKLLATAEKLAIGGVTTLTNAVDALTNIMNAYGLDASQTAKISDVLFIGMRDGKTTVGELSRELGGAIGLAKSAGVSFEELVAAVSAVTLNGIKTSEAVTGVRAAIASLLSPSEELKAQLKDLGIFSVETALKSEGLASVLRKLADKAGNSADVMNFWFGRLEAMPAIMALTSDSVGAKFDAMMTKINDSAKNSGKVTDEAFTIMNETSARKLEIMRARYETILTEIGDKWKSTFVKMIDFAISSFEKVYSAISSFPARMTALFDRIGQTKFFGGVKKEILDVEGALNDLGIKAEKMTKIPVPKVQPDLLTTLENSPKPAANKAPAVTPDPQTVTKYNELINQTKTIKEQLNNLGLSEIAIIDRTTAAKIKELQAINQKLIAEKSITRERQQEINKAIELLNIQKDMLKAKLPVFTQADQQSYDDIIKKTTDIANNIALEGKTQAEVIDLQTQKTMETIAALEKQLFLQAELTNDIIKRGEIQAKLNKLQEAKTVIPAQAQKQKAELLPEPPQWLKDAGKDIKAGFGEPSKAVQSFAGGVSSALTPVTAMMSAAQGIVGSLQQVVDFIPSIFDSVTKLITSITKLPLEILRSIGGFLDSVVQLIAEFIPNLLKAFPQLLLKLVTTIYQAIPDAIVALIDSLPELIDGFIDAMPKIVQEFIKGYITAQPKIAMALLKFVIQGIPEIAWELVKFIAMDLPSAIYDGLVNAFKGIGNMVGNLFSGKAIIDGFEKGAKVVTNMVGDVVKSVTNVSEKMFAVQDLSDAASAVGDKASATFNDGVVQARSAWDKFMGYVKSAWNAILDYLKNVWKAIWEVVKSVWEIIKNYFKNLWNQIWETIKSAWELVKNYFKTMWKVIFETVKAGWEVIKLWFSTIWNAVYSSLIAGWEVIKLWFSTIWNFVLDTIKAGWELIKVFFSQIFTDPLKALKDSWAVITGWFGTLWDSVKTILEGTLSIFTGWFGGIWDSVVVALQGTFSIVFNWFSTIGTTVLESIKTSWLVVTEWFGTMFDGIRKTLEDIFKPLSALIDKISVLAGAVFGTGDSGTKWYDPTTWFAKGGLVNYLAPGGFPDARGTDTVPAMLTPGEFIMSRGAVQALGANRLQMLNSGKMPLGNSINVVIQKMEINEVEDIDEAFIKNRFVPIIEKEIKRASLDGRFVMAKTGVR